jgi:tRNA(Leu) C34 or U34 (ribose-2'-O)-methylase TrmL
VSKNNNIIEINGQRYNALTGARIGGGPGSPKNVDGIVRSAATSPSPALSTPAPRPPLQSVVKKPVMDIARPVHSIKHHTPQASQTLMRRSVQKPNETHLHLKAQTSTDQLTLQPKHAVQPKLSHQVIDPKRQKRALHTDKSQLVSRFSAVASFSANTPHAVALSQTVAQHSLENRATQVAADGSQPSLDMFQQALAKATTHQQPFFTPLKKSRSRRALGSRAVSLASAALAVVLLAGFVTYQNIPNIKLHLASSRVGFAASMPSYRPAGFAVGKLNYDVGNIAISYHSNSDDRTYTLTEKASNWDSQTLHDVYVVTSAGQAYQTVQASGRTIYLFGHNATWVNNGIWYEIQNNGNLSSKQLVNLASSL